MKTTDPPAEGATPCTPLAIEILLFLLILPVLIPAVIVYGVSHALDIARERRAR